MSNKYTMVDMDVIANICEDCGIESAMIYIILTTQRNDYKDNNDVRGTLSLKDIHTFTGCEIKNTNVFKSMRLLKEKGYITYSNFYFDDGYYIDFKQEKYYQKPVSPF